VVLSVARSNPHTNIEPWRVTATGFRHRDTYPLALRKALRYLCRIYEEHLVPTPMRYFPPAVDVLLLNFLLSDLRLVHILSRKVLSSGQAV
jgi:hypothetical protein